ncbi:aconitase X swivel domain-containing protein [Desulfoluna spongiiphila]|uniref:Predicted aconitase subunit 2 n=1 Tax=Desulfoluna spongiiphila TaxID=419481 RepID=A0A1G5DYH9_9BACT|nr:DUF126 domain-containing protein [Desulfoluna spongiiphila]SCY19715.1 predicted aconitase subunit 2 [Desulfoluna spongiiphila]
MNIKGHTIKDGCVEGEALVLTMPFSFLGDFDLTTGRINDLHDQAGASISGKILVFPSGRGSTTGALIGFYACLFKTGPLGMIVREAEPVIAITAVMNNIPMMDRLDIDPLAVIRTGDWVRLDASNRVVAVEKKMALREAG